MSMTQDQVLDKTVEPTALDRRAFLRTLFHGVPDDLFLELRCIHPQTGAVRSFWAKRADQRGLNRIFKQAETLNRADGYSVYFAPGLRQTQKGTAEAVALVPALWLDIDGIDTQEQQVQAIACLEAFDLPPSALIDSGGGLHAYWFLETPFPAPDQECRDQVAGILRGLFAALGGDDGYVKSVASVMRLPDTINTKSERGGVIARVLDLHPDRRYPITAFDWLAVAPTTEKSTRTTAGVTLNAGDHHPLPQRTEQYLTTGAPIGQRNKELFAAACQLRDAGYHQTEAERQLIPRYLADGGSEVEGLKTIQSAYKRGPREPLKERVQEIDTLVERYGRDTGGQQGPTVDEIRAAVTACAGLDPLAWAEERKRIRALCGDTFRVEDLNKMVQQARRERDRAEAQAISPSGRYLATEQGILYEKHTERGVIRQPVTDWHGRITEWVTRIDDDGQEEHLMRTHLQHPMHTTTLDIPGELFGDANGFGRFIAQRAGGVFTVYPTMHRHLPHALQSLSTDFPRRTTYRFMGWTQHEGQWTYLSPGVSVSDAGNLPTPPEVELEQRLRDYGLVETSWDESLNAFRAAVATFPPQLAAALVAFALLPVVQRFFPPAAPRPALHLVGTTGSGKSEIAALMSSFYGRFGRDTPPAQWGDTINTVEVLGYALADGLFWVDDWKPCYADEKTFTRFLQSYSRGMGRGRLTKEAKVRQEKPCRGLLLSTGETTIEGEASILARMLVLEVPPWEKRDPQGQALALADSLRNALPGFTAHFAQWVAAQVSAGTLHAELSSHFETSARGFRAMLNTQLKRQANTGRVIGNWAVLNAVHHLLRQFLQSHNADDAMPLWQDQIRATAEAVQGERAGTVFADTLSQLLASGRVMLGTNLRVPETPPPGVTLIGYQEGDFLYLLPDVTYNEVKRAASLHFDATAVGKQLREDGWLIPGGNSLTVQRRIRGLATRMWQLKAEFLGCDSCDAVTDSV